MLSLGFYCHRKTFYYRSMHCWKKTTSKFVRWTQRILTLLPNKLITIKLIYVERHIILIPAPKRSVNSSHLTVFNIMYTCVWCGQTRGLDSRSPDLTGRSVIIVRHLQWVQKKAHKQHTQNMALLWVYHIFQNKVKKLF